MASTMASKTSSFQGLMDLVAQNQPHFQTHQALLVIGMQNDFIQPDGRLPVKTENGYLDRIQAVIPKFRELNGNVIWVQTLYAGDRISTNANTGEGDALVVGGLIEGEESSTEAGVEDSLKDLPPEKSKSGKNKQRALDLLKRVSARRKTLPQEVVQESVEQDDELFLLETETRRPACVPDTHGAQFADVIAMQFELPQDIVMKPTNYSAFQGTSLLMTLRAKLVTEVYICGCISNVSVLATVIDAARHGVKINVIEDCLGYRKQTRHELALQRMDEFFNAYLVSSADILARERTAPIGKQSTSPSGSRNGSRSSDKPLEALVGRMSLNDPDARPSSRSQSIRSPRILTGGQRKLSLVSVAESRRALNTPATVGQGSEATDEQFADHLVRGATVAGADERADKQAPNLVSKKIRMRGKKKKKKAEDKVPEGSTDTTVTNSEPSAAASHGTEAAPSVAATNTTSEPSKTLLSAPEFRRSSVLSKAESVLNLRERMNRQQSLKTVASQPALTAKVDAKDKEKDRESWSERMRLSLSRASKSESESKKRLSIVSLQGPSTPSKVESRRPSAAATISEAGTPSKFTEIEAAENPDSKSAAPAELSSSEKPTMAKPSKLQSLANLPVLGPGDTIAEGDSRIIHDFFPPGLTHPSDPSRPLRDLIFTQLYNEVRWQKMLHQQGEVPRLVCCQGAFGGDGSMPVYRHPSDQALPLLHFSPKVQAIRIQAEKLAGHPLNHVLIQLYRSGNDYISEHSDKTLDIAKGSSIVNVSFGAQRTMRLRTKKAAKPTDEKVEENKEDTQRETQRVAMPHNSMFVLGLKSNEKWLHGIMADKRLPAERSVAETAYDGIRISLTFRHIATFLDAKESVIWGQGATAKDQRDAADVVNGDAEEGERMIRAFSRENHSNEFDWPEHYGAGFDVLHLHSAPDDLPILFATNNAVETKMAQICLRETKIKYTLIEPPAVAKEYELDRQVAFRDNDGQHTEVVRAISIMVYIDRYHKVDRDDDGSRATTTNTYFIQVLGMSILKSYHNASAGVPTYLAELQNLLAQLEDQLATELGGPFIAGRRFSTADCYVWPVLDELIENWDKWDVGVYPCLTEYYTAAWKKKASLKKCREKLPELKDKAGDAKTGEASVVKEG